MRIKRLFGVIGQGWLNFEEKLGSKNKTLKKMQKTGLLRFFSLMLLLLVIGGITYGFAKIDYKKLARISLQADTSPGLLENHHFSTILNFQSLNEVKPPTAEEAAFEVSHLDAAFGQDHEEEIVKATSSDGKKTQLLRYILLNSTSARVTDAALAEWQTAKVPVVNSSGEVSDEVARMKSFCTGTGTVAVGSYIVNQLGLPEDSADSKTGFENAFLHWKVNTKLYDRHSVPDQPGALVNIERTTPGYDPANNGVPTSTSSAATKKEARIVYDSQYGDFYRINQMNDCARGYEALRVLQSLAGINEDGTTASKKYDGIFIDDMLGGAQESLAPVNSGGKILEYNKTKEEIIAATDSNTGMDPYLVDQVALVAAVKTQAKTWRNGNDFLFLPNTAQELMPGSQARHIADAAGGALTEMWDTEDMGQKWGEVKRWNTAYYVTDNGGYFVWAAANLNYVSGRNGYNANNYAGVPAKFLSQNGTITDETTGMQARHDMMTISSYLMAKDKGNRTMYEQKATAEYGLNVPLSDYWDRAREINIGQPLTTAANTTGKYYLWKSSVNYDESYSNYNIPTNTTTDSNGQPVMVYRRDYDHAMILFRTFSDDYMYDANWVSNWNYGAKSEEYDLGGTYHVLYPNGNLGPAITKIGLTVQEGVVLVPDGYTDLFSDGTYTGPQQTNAQITISNGGTHNTGETFPVSVNLDTKGNTVCAVSMEMTFPKDAVDISGIPQVGSVYSTKILSTHDNGNGTLAYNIGATGCSTENSTLLTINFHGKAAGTGSIDFSNVKIVGGMDRTSAIDIPFDKSGTTVTINGATITAPVTSLTITNGATTNSVKGNDGNNWYTDKTPVFKLTSVPSGGTAIASITYQWDSDASPTVVSNQSEVIDITAPQGSHTITYFATDNAGNKESSKTETFYVDTSGASHPTVDPYNPLTYKSTYHLQGTMSDTNTSKVFGIVYTEDPVNNNRTILSPRSEITLNGTSWNRDIDLVLQAENYTCVDISTGQSRDDCKRAKATKVDLTTTTYAGVESLPLTINITRHMLGDTDGDMVVGSLDLGTIIQNWLNASPHVMSDLNFDLKCDIYDFGTLLANWTEA